jgi:hypothetical protein
MPSWTGKSSASRPLLSSRVRDSARPTDWMGECSVPRIESQVGRPSRPACLHCDLHATPSPSRAAAGLRFALCPRLPSAPLDWPALFASCPLLNWSVELLGAAPPGPPHCLAIPPANGHRAALRCQYPRAQESAGPRCRLLPPPKAVPQRYGGDDVA